MLMLVSATCFAADESRLHKIDVNPNATVYLIKGSLKADQNYRAIWIRFNYTASGKAKMFKNSKALSTNVSYSLTNYIYDCESDKMKVMSTAFYDASGSILVQEGPSEVFTVVPESIGELAQKISCHNYGKEEPRISQAF
jgi:hypothetical protein